MGGTEVQTRVAPLANGNFGGSGLQPLFTSTLAAFSAQGLLDDKAATRAIELLHQLHQVEV